MHVAIALCSVLRAPLAARLVFTIAVAVQCLTCITTAASDSTSDGRPRSNMFARAIGGAGSDDFWGIERTSDAGWILAGETKSFGSRDYDAWVVKLDSTGVIQWERRYGGNATDYVGGPRCLRQTGDGGYVVVGWTRSFGSRGSDGWIMRLDSTGEVTWQKTLGGEGFDAFLAVDLVRDGGIVCAGHTSLGDGGAWVVRLSPSGQVLWQRSYGRAGVDSIDSTADGGYFLVGTGYPDNKSYADMWCLRLDPSGNRRWERFLGGFSWEVGVDGQQTRDGGFAVLGWTESYGTGLADFWVLKLNSSGTPLWQQAYGGPNNEWPGALRQTKDGGLIVVGNTQSFGNGEADGWALRLSATGRVKWQISYGGSLRDDFTGVWQNDDGSYTIVGYTQSFSFGRDDAFLVDVPPDGYSCPQISTATTAVTTRSNSGTLSPPAKTKRVVVSPRMSTASPEPTNAVITDACLSARLVGLLPRSRCIICE